MPPDTTEYPLALTSTTGRRAIIALAVGQALLLLAIHEAVAREWALVEHMRFSVPYLTLVIAVPGALYLLMDGPHRRRPWLLAGGLALVLLPIAFYTGGQVLPDHGVGDSPVLSAYVITLAVAWFVALAFMQTARAGRQRFDYHVLFEAGWYHLLILALAALFTGLFWGVLTLWDALFDVLGVGFFGEIFFDRRFAYAATGLAGGLGIVLTRSYPGATTTALRLLLTLLKALLPLLAFVSLVFLAALPFTGVAPLWATGRPTTLMLVLLLLMVLFLNGAFQDGPKESSDPPPYPTPVRRLVEIAFVALPAYAALSAYALGLRVDQYGWTANRLWAALVITILGSFAVAYAFAAGRSFIGWAGERADAPWMGFLKSANTTLALGGIVLLVLVNTPVLDPHRLAVANQVARLKSGTADANVLRYLRFETGARGYRALQQLQERKAFASQPRLAARLDTVLSRERPRGWSFEPMLTPEQLRTELNVVPDSLTVSRAFFNHLAGDFRTDTCADPQYRCFLLAANLHGDDRREYVLFKIHEPSSRVDARVYSRSGTSEPASWQSSRLEPIRPKRTDALLKALRTGHYRAVPSPWRDLQIGNLRLRVY